MFSEASLRTVHISLSEMIAACNFPSEFQKQTKPTGRAMERLFTTASKFSPAVKYLDPGLQWSAVGGILVFQEATRVTMTSMAEGMLFTSLALKVSFRVLQENCPLEGMAEFIRSLQISFM